MVHLVDGAVQPGNSKDENPHTDYGYSAAVMENYWNVLRSHKKYNLYRQKQKTSAATGTLTGTVRASVTAIRHTSDLSRAKIRNLTLILDENDMNKDNVTGKLEFMLDTSGEVVYILPNVRKSFVGRKNRNQSLKCIYA